MESVGRDRQNFNAPNAVSQIEKANPILRSACQN
jgi:hypothetical protein